MPAHRPDVGIVHAQRADRNGNVQLWGILGVQKETVLASRRSIVTVEEIVDELLPLPGAIVLPAWVVTAVSLAPLGAHPSYAHGYYDRDNEFYRRLGCDQPRPRHVPRLDEAARARHRGRRRIPREPERPGRGMASTELTMSTFTADEMMAVEAARRLDDGAVCFVGIGLPSLASNLARRTNAPGCVLIYESGTIGAKPLELPLSIGDGELADTADAVVSVPEMFAYWLQGGRIDVGFLGAAQIDRHGNLNSTVIGDYERPDVRLPGGGGAPEIALGVQDVFVMMRQSPRSFVERARLHDEPRRPRPRRRHRSRRPRASRRRADAHAAASRRRSPEQVRDATGWELRVAPDLSETEPPSDGELSALRSLRTKGDS